MSPGGDNSNITELVIALGKHMPTTGNVRQDRGDIGQFFASGQCDAKTPMLSPNWEKEMKRLK